MKKLLVALMGLMFLAASATAAPPKTTFLGEYEKNLEPGPEGGVKLRWLKPGVDFTKYNKFMVDYVIFALDPDSQYKGINGDEMKQLADDASLALVNAIQAYYSVVSEAGPDVARIRWAITDLKPRGVTKAGMMLLDSTTNEVIAVAYDEYSPKFTERFTKWGSVEDAFKHWGETGARGLMNFRAGK